MTAINLFFRLKVKTISNQKKGRILDNDEL